MTNSNSDKNSKRVVRISAAQAARDDLNAQILDYHQNLPQRVSNFTGNVIPKDIQNKPRSEKLAFLDGQAHLYRTDFENSVRDIARKIGVKGQESIAIAAPKSPGGICSKADAHYDGDVSQVSDVLRATIYVSSIQQVIKAASILFQDQNLVAAKDQFKCPNENGVRNILAVLRVNGEDETPFHAEIQIVHTGMRGAYDWSHTEYEKMRGIDRRFECGDIDQRSLQALTETFTQRAKIETGIKDRHDAAAVSAELNMLLAPNTKGAFEVASHPASGTSPVAAASISRNGRQHSHRRSRSRGAELGLKQ